MKMIKVANEGWFKAAPYHEVKMLGIKHLNIPADRFDSKKDEPFKRALVRQAYKQVGHKYGEEFEVIEASNPFGKPAKRRSPTNDTVTGEYRFIKNGLRAPDGDIRHEMMKVISENTTFEAVIKHYDEHYGKGHQFPSTGKLTFNVVGMLAWAMKRGWIIKI